MKRVKIILAAAFVLSIYGAVLCGCDSAPNGTLYSLEEVYAAQGIDRDDLLNIAYHNGDQERNKTEMQNFEPSPIGELSEEISLGIRESVAKDYRDDGTLPGMTAENIFIKKYLGCYNGYYAFRFSDNLFDSPEWVTDPEDYIQEVDGIEFSYWGTSLIRLWKKN